MTPFFKSNFFKLCAFMLALVAVSTPFWLFNSTQSIVSSTDQQSKVLDQDTIVSTKTSNTTGTIALNDINSLSNEKNEILDNNQKLKAHKNSHTQQNDPLKVNNHQEQNLVANHQEQKTAQAPINQIDAKSNQEALEDLKIAPPKAKDLVEKTQEKKAFSTVDAIKDNLQKDHNKSVLTQSIEQSVLTEQVISSKEELKNQDKAMTLAQKVKAITEAQTKEQKAQYQRSIEERQEMVDAAIASIAQNSKMYLPSLISSRALVVTFCVPKANASLSNSKDQVLDAFTGATVIKYDQTVDGAMSFIAQRLSKESGADLYYITPTIIYPKKKNKLYQFALSELTEKNYPELTDDVPLNLEKYDTIYLSYPIWWDDLPAAIYSFLIKYDLSDKNIIPVCLHSGDDFSNTINTIITYEPHAMVYRQGLSISTKDSLNSNYVNNKIRAFLSKLSSEFN